MNAMRLLSLLLASLLLLSACATSGTTPASDDPIANRSRASDRAEVQIVQLSSAAAVARHQTGGLPVQYRVRVANRSEEEIRLRRVAVQSIGSGAYTVNSSSSVDLTVAPAERKEVDFWMPAEASTSVAGANGPVTIRATLHFESPSGKFEQILIQQVSGMAVGGAIH